MPERSMGDRMDKNMYSIGEDHDYRFDKRTSGPDLVALFAADDVQCDVPAVLQYC